MTDPILTAWLTVIGRDGWMAARIDAVAAAAGQSTAAVAQAFPDRWAALAAFGAALDVAALAEAGDDRAGSVRDRLFGLLMARFDAAQDQRAAALALAAAAARDPGLAAFMALSVPRSVARLAEAAGVATGGFTGPLRVQVLTVLYLAVARVWLRDDSADLGTTMKDLDVRLGQVEAWAQRMPYRVPPQPGAAVMPPPLALPAAAPRLPAALPAG